MPSAFTNLYGWEAGYYEHEGVRLFRDEDVTGMCQGSHTYSSRPRTAWRILQSGERVCSPHCMHELTLVNNMQLAQPQIEGDLFNLIALR